MDFHKRAVDVLDFRQRLVQVKDNYFTALWVAFGDGIEDPFTTKQGNGIIAKKMSLSEIHHGEKLKL